MTRENEQGMDYEKRYKKALERARGYHKQLLDEDNPEWAGEIENIFPELAESEDERIRKELIDYINRLTVTPNNIDRYNSWIAWLEKQAQSTTITIPKDLKGTDTDGGVVGERGEQSTEEEMVGMGELEKAWFEKELLDHIDDVAGRLHPLYSLLGHFITDYNKKTDKIISLLQPVILAIPRVTYVPTTIYKNPLDPDPNTLGGWKTWASTCTTTDDKNIKIQEDETSKPKS